MRISSNLNLSLDINSSACNRRTRAIGKHPKHLTPPPDSRCLPTGYPRHNALEPTVRAIKGEQP